MKIYFFLGVGQIIHTYHVMQWQIAVNVHCKVSSYCCLSLQLSSDYLKKKVNCLNELLKTRLLTHLLNE